MSTTQEWKDWFSNLGTQTKASAQRMYTSHSIWAKIVFLILVIIVFILLLRAFTNILTWLFTPTANPHLAKGMKDAKKVKVIPKTQKIHIHNL